jgi:2-dehydro-3-deoxyphosphogluconate aldolase/(4S)-4-hydroxy-2-oxoglutarate aldolase
VTLIEAGSLIGIVRYRERGDLAAILAAISDPGISLVEVTLDTPGALEAIAAAAAGGFVIGAGTVVDADEVRACADAGARFVVSPGLVDDVVETALAVGVEPIPGVLSPSELLRARRLGASVVKVFPVAPMGGPALVGALRAPFPDIGLVPTGGIEIEDVPAYFAAGAMAVGLGSALTGRRPPASAAEIEAVRLRAAAAVEAASP